MGLYPRIHASGVGVEHRPRISGQLVQIRDRAPPKPEHTVQPVQRQGGRSRDFGQPAGRVAAHEVHLEHAVARMHEAERRRRVQFVRSLDAWHAVPVEPH